MSAYMVRRRDKSLSMVHMQLRFYLSSNFFLISNLAFLVVLGSFSESLFTIVLSNGTSTEYLKHVMDELHYTQLYFQTLGMGYIIFS